MKAQYSATGILREYRVARGYFAARVVLLEREALALAKQGWSVR